MKPAMKSFRDLNMNNHLHNLLLTRRCEQTNEESSTCRKIQGCSRRVADVDGQADGIESDAMWWWWGGGLSDSNR